MYLKQTLEGKYGILTHIFTLKQDIYIHTKMSINLARIVQYTSMSTQNKAQNVLFQMVVFVPKTGTRGQQWHFFNVLCPL